MATAKCLFCDSSYEENPDQFKFEAEGHTTLVCTWCYQILLKIVKSIVQGLFENLTFKD